MDHRVMWTVGLRWWRPIVLGSLVGCADTSDRSAESVDRAAVDRAAEVLLAEPLLAEPVEPVAPAPPWQPTDVCSEGELASSAKLVVSPWIGCLRASTGRAWCWYLEGLLAELPLRARDVSVRDAHACVCAEDGLVRCGPVPSLWSDDVWDGHVVPVVRDCRAISGGPDMGCSVDGVGGVSCWGAHSAVPGIARLQHIVEVTVGLEHACARDVDGRVFCWGHDEVGETSSGLEEGGVRRVPDVVAQSISAGSLHTCAVVEEGVTCWGWDAHDTCVPTDARLRVTLAPSCHRPTPTLRMVGRFTRVFAGTGRTCALTADGTVMCEGLPFEIGPGLPGYIPPHYSHGASGPYEVVRSLQGFALGGDSACTVDDGGRVSCWGSVNRESDSMFNRAPRPPGAVRFAIDLATGEPCGRP